MRESQKRNSEAVWNLQKLLARVDNDLELLRDLLAIFQEDCPRHIASLDKAIAANDLKTAAAVAHTLKGMLANLATERAAAVAARLELMAREGEKGSLREVFEALQQEMTALSRELGSYSTEVRI